jgi:hypothetical protein
MEEMRNKLKFLFLVAIMIGAVLVFRNQAAAADCTLTGTGTWSRTPINLNEDVIAQFPEQNCNGRGIILKFFGKDSNGDFHIKDLNYFGQTTAIAEGHVSFSASDFSGKTGDIQIYFIPQTSNASTTGTPSQLLTVSQTNNGSSTTGILDLHFDALPGASPKVIPTDNKVPVVLTLTLDTTKFGQYCSDINTTSLRWSVYETYPGTPQLSTMVYPANLVSPLGQLQSFTRSSTPISMTLNATVTAAITTIGATTGFYAIVECGSVNATGLAHKNATTSAPILFNVGRGQLIYSCVASDGKGGYGYACSSGNLPDCSDVKNSATGQGICPAGSCQQISSSLCGSSAPAPGTGGGSGTCSDGIKNGDETGVDTGGRCASGTGVGTGPTCGLPGQPVCPPGKTQTFTYNITNPLNGGPNDIFDIINIVTQWILNIAIPLAVLLILYAGFLMLTAGPVPGNFEKGKKILTQTVIGLAIIFIGRGFITLILSIVQLGGTGTTTTQTQPINQPNFQTTGSIADICRTKADCQGSLVCDNSTHICQRQEGNGSGEGCIDGANCAQTLHCDPTDKKLSDGRSVGVCAVSLSSGIGHRCVSDTDCINGLECFNTDCHRPGGNLQGEACLSKGYCSAGLDCVGSQTSIDGRLHGSCQPIK